MKTKIYLFFLATMIISCLNNDETNILEYNPDQLENLNLDSIKVIDEEDFAFKTNQTPKLNLLSLEVIDNLIQYDFYKTEQVTGYMEYMSVKVLVAIPRAFNKEIIKLESPTFRTLNHSFLELFKNIEFESLQELNSGISEISNIFKEITYNGEIRNQFKDEKIIVNELMHNGRSLIKLKFEIEGKRLLNISIE
ncbi:MAG: hypothetical protein MK105_15605 [Crocinitomicaceae bacterium]|nr:hypothetical protein [Crocinitomicaceae bacterium]